MVWCFLLEELVYLGLEVVGIGFKIGFVRGRGCRVDNVLYFICKFGLVGDWWWCYLLSVELECG